MKLKDYSIIFFVSLLSLVGYTQHSLSGRLMDENNKAVEGAEIYLKELGIKTISNNKGYYEFLDLDRDTYKLVIFSFEHEIIEQAIQLENDIVLDFSLEPLAEQLSEVVLTQRRSRIFALRRLQAVEGTSIYAGKKSEVVLLEEVTGNLAANNPRQIYAQVVGLNIYENGDAGLQLNIGGRGLDPNRTSNFNTRQNGYDISADVLGYPESYYTPPAEALQEIQVVRGAASLQYGTQFGGLVNFKMKQPNTQKQFEIVSRQTLGSYGLFTSFNSISGTAGKVGYYGFFNYKEGDGFRPNSGFSSRNYFAHIDYEVSKKTKLAAEVTYLNYLAQQPGGLTDRQFEEDPSFSNRSRNWFKVDWKLYAFLLDHSFSKKSKLSLNVFGLDASRQAVGFRENRVDQVDEENTPRELLSGAFRNWGAEARFLTHYTIGEAPSVLLIGSKYYQAHNTEKQGPGSAASNADFNFYTEQYPNYTRQSDFEFPNRNIAFFGENIFNITDRLSITPGFRFEYIKTESEGMYKEITTDLAGNPTSNETFTDNRIFDRSFLLLGAGLSYSMASGIEFYGNISQNYRSVTFNDIRVINPSFTVDPNITDEDGFTADLGIRGKLNNVLTYDLSSFYLSYNNRLGVISRKLSDIQEERFRGNIGDAIIYGIEGFGDWDVYKTVFGDTQTTQLNLFVNAAYTQSEYTASQEENVKGNTVEFVPELNLKTGIRVGYKNLLASIQYTYLSSQFSDATNAARDFTSSSGVLGEIPAYDILDLSLSYRYKNWKLETGINNVLDNAYFTRRATGYPGPGIIPAEPITWYTTLQFKL